MCVGLIGCEDRKGVVVFDFFLGFDDGVCCIGD